MNNIIKIASEFINDELKLDIVSNLTKEEAKQSIKQYVIGTKAWSDTTRRARIEGSDFLANKQKIEEYVIKKFDNLGEVDFRIWHSNVLEDLVSDGMSYGLAQKLINMSIKYFYFLEIGFGYSVFENYNISKYQEEFDVPIDSYILKWILLNSLFDVDIIAIKDELSVWTKIDNKDIYLLLQKKAKGLLKKSFPKYPILIAETEVWSHIKPMVKLLS